MSDVRSTDQIAERLSTHTPQIDALDQVMVGGSLAPATERIYKSASVESLSAEDNRLFGRWNNRAEVIGREEGESHDDPFKAREVAIARLRGECGSILGMILLGLLVKVAVDVIWERIKKRFPDKFTGECPPELLEVTL